MSGEDFAVYKMVYSCMQAEGCYPEEQPASATGLFSALHSFPTHRQAHHEVLIASRQQPSVQLLAALPFLGPIRAALLIARVRNACDFRTSRHFEEYCGLSRVIRHSGQWGTRAVRIRQRSKAVCRRPMLPAEDRQLRDIFQDAASTVIRRPGPWRELYLAQSDHRGIAAARVMVARMMAALALVAWQQGCADDAGPLQEPGHTQHVPPALAGHRLAIRVVMLPSPLR